MSFLAELRRRQVFRTAAWYAAAAWVVIQVASTVFPEFGLPTWSVRAVIVAALLGLPVALLLAWSFDLTGAGVRREAAAATVAPAVSFWRLPSLWIALVLGIALTISAQQAWQRLVRPAFEERPGIAVLPFANLSPDPANAYFADGLHEEVLGALAAISGLRVISRTSVQEYRETKRNLREVADALGVSLILEGSVRRDGDDLRLALQLVDGHTDERLWSQTYDRKFGDTLRLQRTVARQVARAIGANLTPAERKNLRGAPTAIPAAYEPYLQALAASGDMEPSRLRDGVRRASEAIGLDPDFAQAYVLRARLLMSLVNVGSGSPEDIDRARADTARALELQPENPEVMATDAYLSVYADLDPVAALAKLSRAMSVAPNDDRIHSMTAFALRRLGRVDDALHQWEIAATLAPGQHDGQIVTTLLMARRYDEARLALEPFLAETGQEQGFELLAQHVEMLLRFLATGETTGWRERWERLAPQMSPGERGIAASDTLLALRDLPGLIEYYERAPEDGLYFARDYILGVLFMATGDITRARPHLEAAAAHGRATPFRQDDLNFTLSDAAVALELLGEHDAAVRAADEAVRRRPESIDAANGADLALRRAWVLIHSGRRPEQGYAELERLMGAYGVQPRMVAVDPLWLMLREDDRVQQILRDAIARQ
jgi:TolB-like protein/Flp pilus assembly protein TadD